MYRQSVYRFEFFPSSALRSHSHEGSVTSEDRFIFFGRLSIGSLSVDSEGEDYNNIIMSLLSHGL
jgi:hypothetical protein